MALLILRFIFILAASGIGIIIIQSPGMASSSSQMLGLFFGMILLSLGVITVDIVTPKKKLEVISAVYFGLIVGLIMTYVAGLVLTPLFPSPVPSTDPNIDPIDTFAQTKMAVTLVIGAILCYSCISLLIQTRNDFRFIIPYVEFAKDVKGQHPLILDTSVVIDGRIADLVETSIIDSELIMPKFAIAELQRIADSSDRTRRSRGRRGLDVLNRLQNMSEIELTFDERELPEYAGQPVDLKLVSLAKHLNGKLVTNDFNLNKVAKLQGIHVINLNDVANSLKPVFLPGELLPVQVIKQGEEMGQGVGYLDDGTMVVIEGGRDYVHNEVDTTVTSVLQTSAGRMIFARFEGLISKNDAPARPSQPRPPQDHKPS